jgi:uncharacterized protein (TIGR03067 family)
MASWRWLAVLWVGTLAVVSASADARSDQVKKLKGTWVVTSAAQDGKPLAEMKDTQITIVEKELTIKSKGGAELSIPFKVDPTKEPNAIDLRLVGGDGWLRINVDMKGIYELDRDTLKLCFGWDDQPRPTEFSDKGAVLMVLKRQK